MKKLQKALILLLSLLMIMSLISCQKAEIDTAEIVLTDQAGRTVTLDCPAQKVVSCYYVTTYSMLSLGISDRLVGIEKKADTRPIYSMANPELLKLPSVGSLKEINCEAIAALTPDLVLLPKKLADSVQALESLGIKTLIVNPETNENLNDMLRLIAKACGVDERADALISWSEKKLEGFSNPDITPTVLFLGNSSFLSAAPIGMYQNDIIIYAGGKNALESSADSYWQEISYETFLSLNPDYIVIPSGASYSENDIINDSVLCELDAVKNGHIIKIPDAFEEWDSPIPSGVFGILYLRLKLHSNDYLESSFRKDIVEFYETFYGFTPSETALDSIS